MKLLSLLISLFFYTTVSATDYYISSAGKDTNTGLSATLAWKTIAKVNAAFSALKPGDRVLFNRGDTFYGSLVISKSGASGSPIVISAYGTGANPIITGFTTVNAWKNLGGNIWESTNTVSTLATCNMVVINGVNTPMGRYPNAAWLPIQSSNGHTSISSSSLKGTPNWAGAELVLQTNAWLIDRRNILSQSEGTLNFITPSTSTIDNQYGFFIQNDSRTLDLQNEWYYNSKTKKIQIYSTSSPTDVKVTTIDNLVTFNTAYVIIENVSIVGSNRYSIYNSTGSPNMINSVIQNCTILFSGVDAINCNEQHLSISNNIIVNSNNNGINTPYSRYRTIRGNALTNIGINPGMRSSGYGSYGITVGSPPTGLNSDTIEYNSVQNCGYNGITYSANFIIRYNYINNYCTLLWDGGGIYGINSSNINMNGKIFNNIVLNGQGNGIYLDKNSKKIEVYNNTIANTTGISQGIYTNNPSNINIHDNICYNNYSGYGQAEFKNANPISGMNIQNNIFVAKTSTQRAVRFTTYSANISGYGTINNNYYCRPIDDTNVIWVYQVPTFMTKTLEQWQTYSHQDANSLKSPVAIKDLNDLRFEYNATSNPVTIQLDKPMIDVKKTKYAKSITLLPFTSAVLMVDPAFIPASVSSSIQNATPALLEMTYSLNLVNIMPATSAFTVQVNSVTRTVSSVAISGTKVQLTLASPIVYGDVVKVTYTKPAANPLQTASSGLAASISAQPVSNNCQQTIQQSALPILKDDTIVYPALTGKIDASGKLDLKGSKTIIYPNPAHDFINISIEDSTIITPILLKITDLSGRVVSTYFIEQDIHNAKINVNLRTGNYIVTLESGKSIRLSQKLIII